MTDTPPKFVDTDPNALTASLIAAYELMTGRALQPAQVERLLIDIMAYEGNLQRQAIQDTGLQNLVRFARAPVLDELGVIVGVKRLPATVARTSLSFTLSEAQAGATIIPKGTRVQTKDRVHTFVTAASLTIAAGEISGEVEAVASVADLAANGYLVGEVNLLVDPLAYVQAVANTAVTAGGTAEETDERLRARILEAPFTFSVAGPDGAYRAFAGRASSAVVDVAVLGPKEHGIPGRIEVYPLTVTGPADAEILALVEAALTHEKVRPIGDHVVVAAPASVDYAVSLDITITALADPVATVAAVSDAVSVLVAKWGTRLGGEIVRSQLSAAASDVAGVHKVALVSPADDVALQKAEWPHCTGVSVNVAGVANG